MRLDTILTAVGLIGVCGLGASSVAFADSAAPEVRGTWMTTTANTALATPADVNKSMKQLRDIGLNTVYVEVWKNGYTQFPSEVALETFGVERRPELMPDQTGLDEPRDLLEETLIAAHRNGLIYIAWFEYGFMAAYKDTNNDLREAHPEWMTTIRGGGLVSDQNPFVWMNPLRPETRDFLMGIVLEAVDKYDLDGVQLDDRIAWPVTMGYDDYTVEVYKQEHGGQAPPDNPRDPDWIRWRADKVTEFAERFYKELKEKRPNLIVSISPAVYSWSLENYACDWPAWNRAGWMDEYVPQAYRNDYAAFVPTWTDQLEAIGPDRDKLLAGIRVVGSGPDTTWDDMAKKMDLVRATKAGGHVHWFSRGVLEVYPEQLTAYYDIAENGQAANPLLPKDWRPEAVLAKREKGQWHFKIKQPGQYRIVVRSGDTWREVESRHFEAGHHVISGIDNEFSGVAAMELLLDRRATPPLEASTEAAIDKPTVDVTVRIDDVFMRESDLEPMSVMPFLDIAERHGARVILNVIPNRLTQSPEADGAMSRELREALARGHEVTQHGFDHACSRCDDTGHEFYCATYDEPIDPARVKQDIAEGKSLLEAATGRPVQVYGGVGADIYNDDLYAALQSLGYPGVTGTPVPDHARFGLVCIPTGSDYAWALEDEAGLREALAEMQTDFHTAVATTGYFQLNFHDHFIRPGWSDGITLRFLDEALTWLNTQDDASVRFIISEDRLAVVE